MSELEQAPGASGRTVAAGTPGTVRDATRLIAIAGLAGSTAVGLAGCETDSFLDPSVTGRWEYTPTRVPILDRISVIEGAPEETIEYADPTPEDLLPEVGDYRIGPGDELGITIFDLAAQNERVDLPRVVDLRGVINIPQSGDVSVVGLTVEQARGAIIDALRARAGILDPFVAVVVSQPRQALFHLVGGFERPGAAILTKPDLRLLEALSLGGRYSEAVREVYVVRQVALREGVAGVPGATPAPAAAPHQPAGPPPVAPTPPQGQSLIDLVEQLSRPAAPGGAPAPVQPEQAPPPTPEKPAPPPPEPKIDLPMGGMSVVGLPAAASQPEPAPPPAIDLPDARAPRVAGATPQPIRPVTRWVFLNGEWIKSGGQAAPVGAVSGPQLPALTQRVIRVQLRPLLAGDARYNIVIRPGDAIRLPQPEQGLVYMSGQVNRIGPIALPEVGRMTLTRAIDSAGGLAGLAIPERLDLTRVVGDGQQAIIRLNYRAIAEGTQPDLYLKADDRINVGTNFWALPLAIVRNGFRATYGFGLLVDRNFGSDVFGVPPEASARFGR